MINATLAVVRSSVKKTFQGRARQRFALFYSSMDVGWGKEHLCTVFFTFISFNERGSTTIGISTTDFASVIAFLCGESR